MQKSVKESIEIEPKKPIWKNDKFKTAVFSVIASISIIIISLNVAEFSQSVAVKEIGIIFGILVGVVPVTIHQLKEIQRKDSIDRNLPIFLLALVSSVQSGSNLIRAIEQASERNLGSLSPELKNLNANISWGIPIEDSFENFAKRTGTRVSRRVAVLLEMALKIGGDVIENLEMIQKHVSEMQNIEKSRKSALQPYTYTIYISFVVFLAVAVLLTTSFFAEIEKVQEGLLNTEAANEGGLFSSLAEMDISQLESALFNMAIIEAVFGGLAAGKIGSGSYVAGTKHVIVMVVVAIISFNIV
ncbi:MAG: type II secretion system F family protein [Nitrosopumilaceae archaeon]|nr:type II secretion system F family protein [Nitrosopumilaceae archaeon]NIU01164.1 type II secretion system F family protein [Nitrosopumilaceae archaeon]NIU87533.1 type II secretion system F family protein [Nitrosopumilaceae archaeon]NIV65998.1 type II secretion system F family protein [Nitrosopumilaceae archaeon]NIX61766.1 type II secretion system F family protein [Nitrosopumilaceae archaeon]